MARTMPDWEPLESAIEGEVALLGTPAYEASRRPFNALFHDVRPMAIVSCATPQDVSEVISFARRHGLDVAMRSGGHSFAGHSTTRGIVLDVTPLRSVSVSGGVATVGAGARLGEVYSALQEHGLAIPAGTCPDVGVAGLTLGGGLGILGRKYGATSDSLVGADIVLADGRILTCDEHHETDLFWALRGAGAGNFGVVTSLAFRTVPAPEATNVHLAWPFSRAADVIAAWQSWAPNGPDELAASLKLTATGDVGQPPSIDMYGAVLGTESYAADLVDDLVARTGSDPISSSKEYLSFAETRRFWAQLGEAEEENREGATAQPSEPAYLFSKSEFFRRPLPTEAVGALLKTFSQARAPGQSRELDFMPWGGAYNRVPPTPPLSSIARSGSSSSTRSSSAPMPPRARRRPHASGLPGPGRRCIHGAPEGCSRTSPIRISRIGRMPTTGRTWTGWCGSRHDMTQGTSFASISRCRASDDSRPRKTCRCAGGGLWLSFADIRIHRLNEILGQ
jgi:hypothetical protein